MGRPARFTVHKPYFNTTTEVHAAATMAPASAGPAPAAPAAPVQSSAVITAPAPPAVAAPARPGCVPGRPVLEVAGWEDPVRQGRGTSAAPQLQQQARSPSSLRIFSGTSNQVGEDGGSRDRSGAVSREGMPACAGFLIC
jgi:hypothetical protein